jgi:hypothetical protein
MLRRRFSGLWANYDVRLTHAYLHSTDWPSRFPVSQPRLTIDFRGLPDGFDRDGRQGMQLGIRHWDQAPLALGPSQGGHPIKIGRRKIIREHIRTFRMQLRDAFANESGQWIAEMVLRL